MVFGGTPFATGMFFFAKKLEQRSTFFAYLNIEQSASNPSDIVERLDKLKAVYHKIVTHVSFLPDNVLEPTVGDLFRKLLALHPSVRKQRKTKFSFYRFRIFSSLCVYGVCAGCG